MTDADNMIEKAAARAKSSNYLPRYGLSREPFANDYDEDFFIVDDERSKRLNILLHLIQHSDLLLLVTGPRGIGKTSMLSHFLGMSTEAWQVCHIQSHAMMHPDVLYRHICETFEISPADSIEDNRDKLQKRLAIARQGDYVPILIIDDAHELPAETLREILLLSEIHVDDAGMLRIVLFSEPQIQDILDSSLLKDVRHRITHTLDIPALTEEQTSSYIKKRLVAAGLHGELPLSQKQMQRIHKQSLGVPLAINRLAHNMLADEQPITLQQKSPAKKSATRPLKSVMLLFAIIGIAGVITVAIMYDVVTRLWHDDLGTDQSPPAPTITLKQTPPSQQTAETRHEELPLPEKQPVEEESLPLVDLTPGVSADKSPQDSSEKTKQEVLGQIQDQDKVTIVTKTAAVKPDSPIQVNAPPHDNTAKTETTVRSADVAATQAKQPAPKPVTPTPKPKPKPPVKAGPASKPQATHLTGTAWLKAQNPSHYTVQVNASRSLQSIRDYIRQHHLAGKTTYMKTTLNGKDWYILLYGTYTNKQLARQAAAKLPAALRKARPWPRRIGDIKPASH